MQKEINRRIGPVGFVGDGIFHPSLKPLGEGAFDHPIADGRAVEAVDEPGDSVICSSSARPG